MNVLKDFWPLPARAKPLPGESLISLFRRTSQAMGYESPRRLASLFCDRHAQLPHLNHLGPRSILGRAASLLLLPAESVSSLTVHHYSPALVLVKTGKKPPGRCDSKTILRYFSATWPVCPRCLSQDNVPYERLLWSFRPLPFCREHGCFLISRCPACHKPLRGDRPDVARCRCGQDLGNVDHAAIYSHGLRLAENLHQALCEQISLLPEMSAAAGFWWTERLAAAIAATPAWLADFAERLEIETAHQESNNIVWLAAAEILAEWPHRLRTFLDEFQQIDKHRTTSTGVSRRFGLLLRQAAYLEDLGYPVPANALRQYLLEHYASGHLSGKICLFQTAKERSKLRRRAWIPQTLAAEMLGLRHGAVAKLVQQGILEGRLLPAGRRGRSMGLVRRESVETLERELRSAIRVETAAKRLGIGRHGVLDLIHGGILPRAVRTAKGWQIPSASVADLEFFCGQLPPSKPTSLQWLTLRQATRRFGPAGLTLALLMELVCCGKLSTRMADPARRLNGIVVSQSDLTELSPQLRDRRDQEHGYPVHQLGKVLFAGRPIKCSVVKKWISQGLLRARKSGRAHVVAAADVECFRMQYCLAEEACRLLDITRSTLSRWEVAGLLRPVYGKRVTPGAGFSLYRREDLVGLSRRRSRAA